MLLELRDWSEDGERAAVKRSVCGLVLSWMLVGLVITQGQQPFKLGTLRQGKPSVGIVLRDAVVIDLPAASPSLASADASVPPPADMKDLIARDDQGLRNGIQEVIRLVEGRGDRSPTSTTSRGRSLSDY